MPSGSLWGRKDVKCIHTTPKPHEWVNGICRLCYVFKYAVWDGAGKPCIIASMLAGKSRREEEEIRKGLNLPDYPPDKIQEVS